ncbi:Cys-Cys-COOH (seleno)protein SaoC [[Clostridium] scindens]|uniref:Cys-Cys-COOH (seleno)protein SaoC n=1 Tax=Clostridium scindens (strain JCM 10418 / VPI 12708) TaxID=29347 RepID=UPI003AA87F9A
MDILKKFWRSVKGKCLIAVLVLLAAFEVHNALEGKEREKQITQTEARKTKREVEYAKPVDDSNQILGKFKEQFPEASVVLACEEDVTDDGCKDLIVIYTEKELTRTVAVIDSGDGVNYNFSTPIPGPIENQKIQFKNIDKEGEIEIIVTGEKKGAVGYAIYRMIDGEMVDLFGEGMEDCC